MSGQRDEMAAVLAEHVGCSCPSLLDQTHADHLADVLAAAGFGPVRAVEAERDEAWRVAAQRRNEARRFYVAWSSAQMRARERRARAESAEAALAGVARLVDAAEWRAETSLSRTFTGDTFGAWVSAADLRALLASTPDRKEES